MSVTRPPVDATTQSDTRALLAQAQLTFNVSVVQGPDLASSVTLDPSQPSRVYIGTSKASALCLSDPKVSRRHLAFDVREGALHIQDLGSTNGTWLGTVRIGDALLSGGEQIRIGETVLKVGRAVTTDRARVHGPSFGSTIGKSRAMQHVYQVCERLAQSDVPVLIEGETGTGKEVLAESIHAKGRRARGPFVICDCTAIAPNLVESALFGHEKGSFTGATTSRRGYFEQAHGGTLLLDEIGDLPLELQAKLLRAIERSQVRRVGAETWLDVDVRVMAATRRDLEREIEERRFRDDLFYRLAVARVELPPLRERKGDVAILARAFWEKLGAPDALPDDFARRLEAYGWPGNVRELRNVVARRIALGDLAPDVPATAAATAKGGGGQSPPAQDIIDQVLGQGLALPTARDLVVENFEKRYIERALALSEGDATIAARASGIARRYFQLVRAKRFP